MCVYVYNVQCSLCDSHWLNWWIIAGRWLMVAQLFPHRPCFHSLIWLTNPGITTLEYWPHRMCVCVCLLIFVSLSKRCLALLLFSHLTPQNKPLNELCILFVMVTYVLLSATGGCELMSKKKEMGLVVLKEKYLLMLRFRNFLWISALKQKIERNDKKKSQLEKRSLR